MKKFSLFLALLVVSFAFAGNGKSHNSKDSEHLMNEAEAREKSRDCHWVCENGEMKLYNGNKKVNHTPSSSGKGGIGDMMAAFGGSECPRPFDTQKQSREKYKRISETCGRK